ncbi:MAG: acyl-CoA reductase [candidate division KSB1 bacterium]|nr:acyl-CoA reductase [candidate division KSB1 bacterium]MDZ7364476.1 acyl-CoA reductase [candidate division KSB1 bacterium]MDZ7402848.1 acyl-CoA reductase [candidate division KSB1 bacterium]
MRRDFFIPAGFAEPGTTICQHESDAPSGVMYESAQLSAEWLGTFLENFHRPAWGFGKGSKDWQARAIKAWCQVAREWQTLKFSGAEKILTALAAVTGLSSKMLQEALHNHFFVFDAEVLKKWLAFVKRERDQHAEDQVKYPALAFLITAGNIPGVAIHPVIHLSLLGIPVLIKNASSEPFLLPAILETLARHDPDVAARIAAFTWPRENADLTRIVLQHNPALIAFGDDQTIEKFAQQKKSFVDFGDRFSLTVVNPVSAKAKMRHIAYDLCMFEQMGCLSPQAVILLTDDWKKVERFCVQLAEAMRTMNVTLPLGKRSAAQHAAIQQWRGALAARGAAGEKIILLTSTGTDWTVAAAKNFDLNERVACRFARVWPVASIKELAAIIHQYKNKVQTVIWGNSPGELQKFFDSPELHETFDDLFYSFAGFAQAPNCGWLDDVNPAWRRLTRGLRFKTTLP